MKLDKAKFRAWLEAKPPMAVVGEHRTCCACPLAQFYVQASGGFEVSIFDSDGEYFIDRGYSKRPLPVWASNFVTDVDDTPDLEITAGRALEILQRD
jgi:hypothetical protein